MSKVVLNDDVLNIIFDYLNYKCCVCNVKITLKHIRENNIIYKPYIKNRKCYCSENCYFFNDHIGPFHS